MTDKNNNLNNNSISNSKPDPLDNLGHNKVFQHESKNIKNPYSSKNKEPTKSVQIRKHSFRAMKILSVLRKESMTDISSKVLDNYLQKQPELKGVIGKYINNETKPK